MYIMVKRRCLTAAMAMAVAVAAVLVGLVYYEAIRPPPPRVCGSPNGPPITSPRIKLRDGRHLAYKESGTPREKAIYKIVFIHGFAGTKEDTPVPSQVLVEEVGVYLLSYDRAGYGESDPNPNKTLKSEAIDVVELADRMELGSRFYVYGASLGAYVAWSCLHYKPHRLAGVALVVPMVNYWWDLPANLSSQVYRKLLLRDQISLWIAHHAPPLVLYWWMTQKWFPTLAAAEGHPAMLTPWDREIVSAAAAAAESAEQCCSLNSRQQGDFESIHRDLAVAFSRWEFEPTAMRNPFVEDNTAQRQSVHIWQGREDRYCPVEVQRYVAEKLPWIKYHEHPTGGHAFTQVDGWVDAILNSLLLGHSAPI